MSKPNESDETHRLKREIKILSSQLGMVEDEKRRHLEANALVRISSFIKDIGKTHFGKRNGLTERNNQG